MACLVRVFNDQMRIVILRRSAARFTQRQGLYGIDGFILTKYLV